jgi:hypothetical protein
LRHLATSALKSLTVRTVAIEEVILHPQAN